MPRPAGGLIAMFEIAGALARDCGDTVQIAHLPTPQYRVAGVDDLPWFDFEPAIEHKFLADLHPELLPQGDVTVYTTLLVRLATAPRAGQVGRRLVNVLRAPRSPVGLPILLVQGGVFPPGVEELALGLPGPKVCVGSRLAQRLVAQGVPASDVVHIANGVDHDTFRITRPIADRQPRVAMNYDPLAIKGGDVGLDALLQLHQGDGTPSVAFGTRASERTALPGIDFVLSPDRTTLSTQIYNRSSLYLQPSRQEGFGLCAIEAMACGCALVTTANGGSDDYAVDGETALVCGNESDEMVDAMYRLVHDDALRRSDRDDRVAVRRTVPVVFERETLP